MKSKDRNMGTIPEDVRDAEDIEIADEGGEAGPPDDKPSVTITLAEYKELKAQAAEFKDRYLRAAADFDNLLKRVKREREEMVCHANEKLVLALLPVLDNLERALLADNCNSTESIVEGIRMISEQLHGVLEGCGLESLDVVGDRFDPGVHEAVGVLPTDGHEEGTVLDELQRGYRFKGKVLRHSMVNVAGPSDRKKAK